jgi:KDO2-lipid IV(A) lauroyltransferase
MLIIKALSLCSLSVLYRISDYIIYPLARYIVRYRLRLVRKNIRLSFPEKTDAEQKSIINNFYHHFADLLVEIVYGYRISEDEMRERVVFENLDVVEQLANQNHGCIAYLGHMCNWEWIADIGNQFSDPTIVEYNVYRRQKSERSNRAILAIRDRRGGECIEKNLLLRKLVQLRQASHNFVIGLIADQKPSPRNAHIWTTFLNQDTAFLDGGEVLARKFNYAVVFAHIISPSRGYYRIRFEVITDSPTTMGNEEITLTYARLLEQNIRQQPHMWLWTHNRWKWGKEDSVNNRKRIQ